MIARRFRRGSLEALERPLESLTRPQAEEVIAVPDQGVRLEDAQAVAALRLVKGPKVIRA